MRIILFIRFAIEHSLKNNTGMISIIHFILVCGGRGGVVWCLAAGVGGGGEEGTPRHPCILPSAFTSINVIHLSIDVCPPPRMAMKLIHMIAELFVISIGGDRGIYTGISTNLCGTWV